MPIWGILLIVWAIGIPVAYVVVDRMDVAWMRRCQWTEKGIEESRREWRTQISLISLASWFMVVGSIKFYVKDKRLRVRVERALRELEEVQKQIEGMEG